MAVLGGLQLNAPTLKQLLKNEKNTYFTTPELNDKLYIHYKGYKKLESLESFTGLKTLYAEGNGFTEIQGLDCCTRIRSLYLQENCIRKIENLDKLIDLRNINLGSNFIETIENLEGNNQLSSFQISKNRVGRNGLSDVSSLAHMSSVSVLDISDNEIDDAAILDDVLAQMPSLAVLYLKGNPVCRKIPDYRKRVISTIKTLKYLDDRPVFSEDRRCAEAFCLNGLDGEREERKRMEHEEKENREKQHESFKALIQEARAEKRERDLMTSEDDPSLNVHQSWQALQRARFLRPSATSTENFDNDSYLAPTYPNRNGNTSFRHTDVLDRTDTESLRSEGSTGAPNSTNNASQQGSVCHTPGSASVVNPAPITYNSCRFVSSTSIASISSHNTSTGRNAEESPACSVCSLPPPVDEYSSTLN